MNYKVSVIIPCYNAEGTIERTINSVVNQTLGFENIELLLYDDASTDNTKNLLIEYSKNHKNIITIFGVENKGPGFGKNRCLEKASGEYVLFLDSDDEYEQHMCDKLYSTAKSENADLVSSGILRHDNINVSKRSLKFDATKALENTEDKVTFINNNVFYLGDHLATHCLFKFEIIKENNIYFLETYYAEDIYFKNIYRIYSKKSVYLKNYFGYIHNAYTNSITSHIDLNDLNQIHEIQLKILEELKKYDLDLSYIFRPHIICSLIRLYSLNLIKSPKNEVIDFLKKIRDFEIDINFSYEGDLLINILNSLLLKERYNLAYIYLHLLKILYNSKTIRKLSRKILKNN